MKAKIAQANRKPVEIKRGSASVKIYAGTNRVGAKVYPQFTLVYYDGRQRKKARFADLGEAKREGELVATTLANGENDVLRLTSRRQGHLRPSGGPFAPLGRAFEWAVLEYASAVKSLPGGATLKEAVDFFKKRNPASLEKRASAK